MLNKLIGLKRVIYAMYCTRFGYVVFAPEYSGAVHYAVNFYDYLDWLQCYPANEPLIVMVKGKKITWRMGYYEQCH